MIVALAHGSIELDSRLVEFGFELSHVLQRRLLSSPALLQGVKLFAFSLEILAEFLQTLLGGVVLFFLEGELFDAHPVHGATELIDFDGGRFDFHFESAGRLIDEVDCFVRQLPSGDVAVGQRRSGHESAIGNHHFVVCLVALLQSAKDRHGVLHAGLSHENLLEPTLESGVLFDVLAILIQGGRADQAKLTPGEHGLQHIGGSHRALATTGTHQGVKFVDKGDDLALGVIDFFQDCFEAFFKLSPVLCACHDGGKVERNELLVFQRVRHVASDYPLGQTLHHCGLTYSRFTNQHRVVFGSPGQHLGHPTNLSITANNGVELAFPSNLGQVHSVLLKGTFLALRLVLLCHHVPPLLLQFSDRGWSPPEGIPHHHLVLLLSPLALTQGNNIAFCSGGEDASA